MLGQLKRDHRVPQVLRSDKGPEFLGETFTQWARVNNGVAIQYIQPGKPNRNAFIERFNRTFREEVLDHRLFAWLGGVRKAAHCRTGKLTHLGVHVRTQPSGYSCARARKCQYRACPGFRCGFL